jgi:hypothetical protein
VLDEILRFLQTNEPWVYAILTVFLLISLPGVFRLWNEYRTAIFGLEREIIQHKLNTALTVVFLLMAAAVAEFFIVTFVTPSMPNTTQLPTPTLNLLALPTPTQLVGTPVLSATKATVQVTVTPSANGCLPGRLEWTFPKMGEAISGTVALKGTVNLPNLGFYKYEYSPVNSTNWITIAANNVIVINNVLGGQWNTGQLAAGDYLLRLVVTESNDNVLPPCVIAVRIIAVSK